MTRFLRCIFPLLLLPILLFAGGAGPAPERYAEYVEINAISHRGFCSVAPENTLSAFRLSEKMGFETVECDVSFTSDGQAVLLHDATVDRTSNGTGEISKMTLEEVRALDFGSWKSIQYAGEKIPTFEEFLALCRELELHAYVELKSGNQAQVLSLLPLVEKYGMNDRVTWISMENQKLSWIVEDAPRARCGRVVGKVNPHVIENIKKLRTGQNEVFVNGDGLALTKECIELCKNHAVPLEVWALNTHHQVAALDSYVSGVTSDNIHGEALMDAYNRRIRKSIERPESYDLDEVLEEIEKEEP